jgi:GT2 family glycosyltransferase/glycosyltransferase involved in cell wall biosynthesis
VEIDMAVLTARSRAEAGSLLADAPSPVVVVPIYNAHDEVICCLEAVVAHTPSSIAILVVDDAGTDQRAIQWLRTASARIPHHVVVLEHRDNKGYVKSCNAAFAATHGRDVVLLNSDVVVGAEWLERLKAAALSSDSVATATTLTNHGTIVSVPYRNYPLRRLPDQITPAEAARRVAAASRQLRPTIPTAVGHCCYIRRLAIDLLGPFDETFTPGYGEEVDFSERAVAHGFRHVVADDVFTYHRGGASFGDGPEVVAWNGEHNALIQQRYPWYHPWVECIAADEGSGLAQAVAVARRSLLGLTVGVDAQCLASQWTGTQHNVVESIRALARRSDIKRLIAFVPNHLSSDIQKTVEGLGDVEFVGLDLGTGVPERAVDVLYRPHQVNARIEIEFLHRSADRFVVNQLDTIAFENPSYFGSYDEWLQYRNLTRLALGLAQGVAFTSASSQRAALAAGLLDSHKPQAVVSCGADGPLSDEEACPAPCSQEDDGFLLCIGTSYLHKNWRFALELWAELRRRGWPGRIVFAGATPPHGNSLALESEFLLSVPHLHAQIIRVGAVSEAEKRWLYRHAALVLYPSTVEGFGLVPLEAARNGTPTLTMRQESLDEVLPVGLTVLDGFDVCGGADRAWTLLHDSSAATEVTRALQERGRSFTWDATVERLMTLFDRALGQPRSRLLLMEGEGGTPVGLSPHGDAPTFTADEHVELLNAHEELERLIARKDDELLGTRQEMEFLRSHIALLEGELAALRDTRTWRVHDRLVRSTALRSLFARRVSRISEDTRPGAADGN